MKNMSTNFLILSLSLTLATPAISLDLSHSRAAWEGQASFQEEVESALSRLSSRDLDAIVEHSFKWETGQKKDHLVEWSNANEYYPSMGIGHFIWFPYDTPKEQKVLTESFRAFLEYLKRDTSQMALLRKDYPAAMNLFFDADDSIKAAPWSKPKDFENFRKKNPNDFKQILDFFDNSKMRKIQGDYLVKRLATTLPEMLGNLSKEELESMGKSVDSENLEQIRSKTREELLTNIRRLLARKKGIALMADYGNFKGSGNNPDERYWDAQQKPKGWGLKQVIANMDDSGMYLKDFSNSASALLRYRTELSRLPHNERPNTKGVLSTPADPKFLNGWLSRTEGYANFKISGLEE